MRASVVVLPLLLILLAMALLAAAAPACARPVPLSDTDHAADAPVPMPVNRIAYIDAQGQLLTVRPDGSDRNAISAGAVADAAAGNGADDGDADAPGAGRPLGGILAQPAGPIRLYAWPAWSPDGRRIAVSRIAADPAGDAEISVRSLDAATGVGGAVFVNAAPLTIADGTPHYVQWSPDGRRLGITAATPQGLTLFVVDADPADGDALPPAPLAVQRGAPLYFDWAPDSQSLAVHSGETVSVLRLADDFTRFAEQPLARSVSFRTPLWSPDGAQLAWSAPGGDGEAIWLGRPAAPDYPPLRLAEVDGRCAFAWSPDGSLLAVADRPADNSPAYRRLRLLAADGSAARTIQSGGWTLSFFWEPAGSRLAWVALNTEERTMEWRLAETAPAPTGADDADDDDGDDANAAAGADNADNDAAGDRPVAGLGFSPSGETFLLLAFFDQYARSHSPWAPDGSALAVSGSQHYFAQRRNGSGGGGARIYVAETGPRGALREIAAGSLAVWSTR